MYQKQIEQLVVLQNVDDEIIILRKELDNAPKELAELDETLQEFRARLSQIDEKLDILKTQQVKLDNEIGEDSSRVKKSKNKLMMVGNTKEYHAMMREMDSLEKLNRMREEERVAVIEELGRQAEAKNAVNEEKGGVKEEFDVKKASLEERVAKAQKRLDTLERKRNRAGKVVPAPILSRYEFIRERMPNPVIVVVSDGVCGGCNIMIPPQNYNELQQGTQILSCPNCQRLIFWDEVGKDEEEPVKATKGKAKTAKAKAKATKAKATKAKATKAKATKAKSTKAKAATTKAK